VGSKRRGEWGNDGCFKHNRFTRGKKDEKFFIPLFLSLAGNKSTSYSKTEINIKEIRHIKRNGNKPTYSNYQLIYYVNKRR
jgi:hypothetical protein